MKTKKGVTTISGIENGKTLETSLDQQIRKFKKILDENPDDLSVLMVYAESNLRKGNRLEAMKAYQKVVKIKPGVPDVRNALARIYLSLNHYRDAYNEIVKVLDMDPKNIEGHLLLKKLVKKSEIPENFSEILEFHLEFKASPRKINLLKKQFDLEKRKYSALISDYERQLEDDEGNPIIMFNKSKAEERLSFAEETLEDLETMIGEEEEEEIYPGLEKPVEIEVPSAEESTEMDVEVPDYEASPDETLVIDEEETPDSLAIGIEEEEGEEEAFIPEIGGASEDEIFEAMETSMEEPEEEEIPELVEEEPVEEPEEKEEEEEPEAAVEEVPGEEEKADEEPAVPVETGEEKEDEATLISDERMSFYDEMEGSMSKVLKTLNRTRGVTSSLIMDNTGYILCIETTEKFDTQELAMQVLDGVSPLLKWGKSEGDSDRELLYWVLEFKKGLMVLQPLTPEIHLVVLGRSGANFGAVRYSIEKNTGRLVLSLKNVPA